MRAPAIAASVVVLAASVGTTGAVRADEWSTPPPAQAAPGQPPPASDPWLSNTPPPELGRAPPDARALANYYEAEKSMFAGMALQYLLPGVGQIYADHLEGALVTWACVLGGIALVVWDIQELERHEPGAGYVAAAGIALFIGGQIYGYIDVYRSIRRFNDDLRARLHVPESLSLDLRATRTPEGMAFGPRVGFRF
jgi:hypothetical protein